MMMLLKTLNAIVFRSLFGTNATNLLTAAYASSIMSFALFYGTKKNMLINMLCFTNNKNYNYIKPF